MRLGVSVRYPAPPVESYLLLLILLQGFLATKLVSAQVPLYGQCGGEGYVGDMQCATNGIPDPLTSTVCKSINQFYHHCTTCTKPLSTYLNCPRDHFQTTMTLAGPGSMCVTSSCVTMTQVPLGGQCGGWFYEGSTKCLDSNPDPRSTVLCKPLDYLTATCHACEVNPPATSLTCNATNWEGVQTVTAEGPLCYTSFCKQICPTVSAAPCPPGSTWVWGPDAAGCTLPQYCAATRIGVGVGEGERTVVVTTATAMIPTGAVGGAGGVEGGEVDGGNGRVRERSGVGASMPVQTA